MSTASATEKKLIDSDVVDEHAHMSHTVGIIGRPILGHRISSEGR
jgi:hypothetical protein